MCLKSLSTTALAMVVSILATGATSQPISINDQIWSAEVIRPSGMPIIPLFDGWFTNDDGTHSLCFSYFNPNTEQSLEIPAGERNFLSDDQYDILLPTHFDPLPPRYRHKFCVFTVTVAADFGRNETIVWTLSSAGETLSVPGHIQPPYVLDEPRSDGRGDIAPLVRLAPRDEGIRGRKGIQTDEPIQARLGAPLQLQAWIEHPDQRVWVGWAKHSGPGDVEFDNAESEVNINQGPAVVSASFSEPGDYIVRMQTIDSIAAFEFYCCHSNAYFNVTVSQ